MMRTIEFFAAELRMWWYRLVRPRCRVCLASLWWMKGYWRWSTSAVCCDCSIAEGEARQLYRMVRAPATDDWREKLGKLSVRELEALRRKIMNGEDE